MSLLNEALKQIVVGDDPDFKSIPQVRGIFKGIVEMEEIFNEKKNNDQNQSDDDESVEKTAPEQFFLNDPLVHDDANKRECSVVIEQSNLSKCYKKILIKENFLKLLGEEKFLNKITMDNSRVSSIIFIGSVIFAMLLLRGLRYLLKCLLQEIYNDVLQNYLYRHKKQSQQFTKEYYDDIKQNFKLLNERQLQELQNKNLQIEQCRQKLKEPQQSYESICKNLSQLAKLQNESKDDYFLIVSGTEISNKRIVNNLSGNDFRNQNIDDPYFYEQLYHIGTRKRVRIESPYKVSVNQEMSKQQDQSFISQFFGSEQKYELWGNYQRDMAFNSKQEIDNLAIYSDNLEIEYEQEMAGTDIQKRIIRQIQAEKRLNEQLRENKFDLLDDAKQQVVTDIQEEQTQQNPDQEFTTYYNEHIVKFCMGEEEHFLERPFDSFKRVEIDLSDPSFFCEKLEVLQHLKRTKVITSQVNTRQRDVNSLISRPQDQTSLKSFKMKNSELASIRPNEHVSVVDSAAEYSDKGEEDFQIEYPSNNHVPEIQFLGVPKEDQFINDIQFLIENHQKKKQAPAPFQNSIVSECFLLNDFSQSIERHRLYHRSNLHDILFQEKERQCLERKEIKQLDPWMVSLVGCISNEQNQVQNGNLLLEESAEKLNSQDCFKTLKKLSILRDDFLLLEYLEQKPIVLNDTGMCIKASRYLYDQRALGQFQKYAQNHRIQKTDQAIQLFKNMIVEKFGKFGQIQFLTKNEFLPTQGQLLDDNIIGLTIIENDLYRAPIFKSKLPETDFLLVRRRIENGIYEYVIRQIEHIYLVGQIEPKEEIYTPHSRSLGTFLKNCLKTYIKQRFRAKGTVSEDDLQEIFPKQSKQNRRNALKECNGVQDVANPNIWHFNTLAQQDPASMLKYDITAKQVCRYESMLHSSYLLHKFGLRELKNSDKMKKTLQVFLQRHPKDYRDWVIARRIEDELNMTSWSLSASFLHSANQTGRMMLYGFGDPTGCIGGLSYVKKPLKARGEKDSKNMTSIEKKPVVMGTDDDLRKLHVHDTRAILLKLGRTAESIANLKRWKMIDQIAKITQQALEEQDSETAALYRQRLNTLTDQEKHQLNVIIKFAKNQRLTTKMQKDQYQKELNAMLNLFVQNVTAPINGNLFQDFKQVQIQQYIDQFKQIVKKKKIQDEKIRDVQFEQHEIDSNQIDKHEDYMLKLDVFLKKEKKIWEDKKRKKGLE